MSYSLLITVGFVLALYALWSAYDRWIQPRITRRWIDKLLAKVRSGNYVPPTKRSAYNLSIDATGIGIGKRRPTFAPWRRPTFAPLQFIAWNDIVRVLAFKRDLFTVDCICLAIATRGGT